MAQNSWRTLPNGQVEVNGRVPTFSEPHRSMLRSRVIEQWGQAATEAARRYGIPVHWVLGMIYRESGGQPEAMSPVGAVGLMQLYSSAALDGHTRNEVMEDPELNIRLGVRYMAVIRREGDSLVEVASKYNAGQERDGTPHPSNKSPWGYRENEGHISAVVTGANTAIELGIGGGGASPSPTKSDPGLNPSPTDGAGDTAPPEPVTLDGLLEEIGTVKLEFRQAVASLENAAERLEQATNRALELHQAMRANQATLDELAKRIRSLPCQPSA